MSDKSSSSLNSRSLSHVSHNPTVSVIMNCFNGEKYLREAIDSVYAQTYVDWEIIFWDNASTDNSREIVRNYDSRLKYFRGNKTIPLYAARNCALKQASGRYIAILDCDDMWLPKKLELQMAAFEKITLGLVHTNAEVIEYNGTRRAFHNRKQPSGMVFRELLRDYRINLQTVMISRDALEGLDYWFDESMMIAGDADMFLRIAYRWELLYIPEVTACYREHGSSLTATRIESLPEETEEIIRNLTREYNDIPAKYSRDIKAYKRRTRLAVVVAKLKYVGGSEARKAILRNIKSPGYFLLMYILTFLPYKLIHFMRYKLLKGISCL